MFVPTIWLKDYVDIPNDIHKFERMMTLSGTMVEGYEYRAEHLNNIVAAKVTQIQRHPDSDHMWICTLDDNENTYTIVTGAQNVKNGDIVPLARNNSVIAGGKKIKTSVLRGVESQGMLCSAQELGINSSLVPKHSENGIYILPEDTKVGEDIKTVLGLDDYIVEFELTNNRQDCNSVLGIAYEASATQHKKFDFPKYEFTSQTNDIDNYLTVEVKNYDICPRYTAKMLKIKKIEPSPMWMQICLMGAGVRPINNIVDVSNFVMLEIGQPLHTFDYDKIAGHKIIVANANEGDEFVTLDGTSHTLTSDYLMINDENGPIAIAGVMGGGNSDIDENSKFVVIESANFNGVSIRNTAKKLGMRTEASAHYEKGISVNLTKYAADRAASLMVEIGAAEYIDGVIDVYENLPEPKQLSIDINWYNKFIGLNLTIDEAASYLNDLGFEPVISENIINVTVPRFRQDINIKEDLAEEITRMYGYANIPMTRLESSNYISEENSYYRAKQEIKKLLINAGGCDTLTYAFISPNAIEDLNLAQDDIRNYPMTLINPLGTENSVMRTCMAPSILETLKLNYNKKNKPQLMFELASIYLKNESKEELPEFIEKISLGKYNSDFYELKSILNYLFDSLKINNIEYIRAEETFLHPGRSAYVLLNGENIGYIGQIHPYLAKKYEICDETIIAELSLKPIIDTSSSIEIKVMPPAKYPSVERDLALLADDEVLANTITKVIKEFGGEYLINCEVFDVYRSEALGTGKKSIAFNLLFRSETSTLHDEDVDGAIANILKGLKEKLNIELR